MKKKLGPLPLWAWGVVTVVGVGLAIYIRRRQAGAASLPGTASDAVPAQDTGTGTTGIPVSSGGGAAGSSSNPGDLLGAYQAGEQSGLAAFSSAGQFYSSIFGSALSTLQGLYPVTLPAAPAATPLLTAAPAPSSSPVPHPSAPASPPSVNTGPGGSYSTFYYKQGVTVTPENVILPPTTVYSSNDTGKKVSGPSIFAFK